MAPMVKNPPANAGDARDEGLIPGLERSPWRRKWQPTLVFLPGKFQGQRSLVGYSPWAHKELDMTEQLPPTSKKKKKRTNLEFKEFAQNCTVIKGWSQNSTPGTMSAAAAAAKSLQSCLTLRPHRQQPTRLRHPWDSPGKNTGVSCHFLLHYSL